MKKKISGLGILISILILIITGCSSIPGLQATQDSPVQTTATPTITPPPTQITADIPTTINLSVWLSPRFSPNEEDPAGSLLLQRINEFNTMYPNLNVTFRIKAESGPASLLESLDTARKAAPLVLPDLVLLSSDDMIHAAEEELIFPYPESYFEDDNEDWYDAAFPLGNYQLNAYGIPFAADALVAVYNPLVVESFPTSWSDLLLEERPISFPVADPQAVYTLDLYLSNQGRLVDDENNIILEAQSLTDIFSYYSQALSANLLPPNPAQIDTDESAFSQLLAGRSEIAITWASRHLALSDTSVVATTPPSIEGNSFTVMKGWVWSVTSPDPNEQAAAMELARFLSAPEFTGPWTEAANLLPLRPSALDRWQNEQNRGLAGLLLSVGEPVPPPRVKAVVSTPIRDAILDVITGVQTPSEASQSVMDILGN
ncbi:MAG: extracellular solute-binding protein [Anaerolineales bacterium]|jgi:ABC-type glycerol-3-phosphate transport system substrate-binding protein